MIDSTILLLLVAIGFFFFFRDARTQSEEAEIQKRKELADEEQWMEALTAAAGGSGQKRTKDGKKKEKKRRKKKSGQTDFEPSNKKPSSQTFVTTGKGRFSSGADGAAHLDYLISDSEEEEAEEAVSKTQLKKQLRAKQEQLGSRGFAVTVLGGSKRSTPAGATDPKLEVGEKVYARFDGGGEFFPGTVSRVHRYGEYTVSYDDGETESKVPRKYIRTSEEMQEAEGGDAEAEAFWEDQEDGWHEEPEWRSMGTRSTSSAAKSRAVAAAPQQLTKKQRESRRKREKQREMKEAMRAQSQEHGLHKRWGGGQQKWSPAS